MANSESPAPVATGNGAFKNDRRRDAINSIGNPQTNSAQVELFYGTARAPLARAVPDDRYPSMWRIAWPDGRVSDMTNLTRARDAAAAICERGPPARNRRLFRWERDTSRRPPEARTARQAEEAPQ